MSDEQQVRDLEDARYRAMERGDASALRRMLHPDLAYAHSNGARDTAESLLQKVESRHFVYGPIDHPVERVVVHGSTAVVVGRMRARVEVTGEVRQLDNSALAVWTRHDADGSWLLLAYQPTPLPAG